MNLDKLKSVIQDAQPNRTTWLWNGGLILTIADVMVAIDKKKIKGLYEDKEFYITSKGEFTFVVLWPQVVNPATWDLTHDDIDWHAKHKPETIKFLTEILL